MPLNCTLRSTENCKFYIVHILSHIEKESITSYGDIIHPCVTCAGRMSWVSFWRTDVGDIDAEFSIVTGFGFFLCNQIQEEGE